MTDGIEALYDYKQLHPCDLLGILVRESVLCGVINNFPLRRRAVPYDAIDLYAGNKRRFRVFIKDANLNIINLTGALCVFTFRLQKGSPIIFQKHTNIPAEGMIGSADQGECFFYVQPSDTANLDICQYVFDVTVTLTGGDGPYTTVEGVVNLMQPVY
jgi:hypothetical protein